MKPLILTFGVFYVTTFLITSLLSLSLTIYTMLGFSFYWLGLSLFFIFLPVYFSIICLEQINRGNYANL